MDASLRSRWRALHRGAGALFGVVLFVVLFSGTWSLATDSMQGWWRPSSVAVAPSLSLNELVARAAALGVPLREARVVLPRPDDPRSVSATRARRALALDPATGEQLADGGRAALLVTLHKTLFAGFPGRIFVSLWGIVLLVLIVAGLIVHHRRWPDAARIRRGNCAPRCSTCTRGSACGACRGSCCSHSPARCRRRARHGVARGRRVSGAAAARVRRIARRAAACNSRRRVATRARSRCCCGATRRACRISARSGRAAWLGRCERARRDRRHDCRPAEYGGVRASPVSRGGRAGLADATSRGRGFWLRTFIAVQPLRFAQYGWVGAMGGVLRVVHFLMPPRARCARRGCIWDRAAARAAGSLRERAGRGRRRHLRRRARGRRTAVRRACVARWRARRSSARDAVLGRVGRRGRAGGLCGRSRGQLRGLMRAAGAAYGLAGVTHCAIALLGAGEPVYWPIDAALVAFGALLLRAARRPRRDALRPARMPAGAEPFNVMQLETSMRDLLEHRRWSSRSRCFTCHRNPDRHCDGRDADPAAPRRRAASRTGVPAARRFAVGREIPVAPVVDNRWSPRIGRRRAGCCRCRRSSCCASAASRRSA